MHALRIIPLCFTSPKSIKFELSALLPFRKYIGFSTLPGIKKLPIFTSDTLILRDFSAQQTPKMPKS